ncbi:MAG TPA: hypothetical protein VFK09_03990 [Gemmatimonadales bacterium]|nr:hypothetical protein [Gemmatimonadales bacterium]
MAINFRPGAAAIVLVAAIILAAPGRAAGAQAAPPRELVYAVYDGVDAATSVYAGIKGKPPLPPTGSYAVVANDGSGQVVVLERQANGFAQTAVLSGIVALLSPGPDPNRAGAEPTPVDSLRAALSPGTSAILAIVDQQSAPAVAQTLQQTHPRQVLSQRVTTQ